jgi:dihydrofolate reductase
VKTRPSGDVRERLTPGAGVEAAHELEVEIEQIRARLAANEAERKELEATLRDLVSRRSTTVANYSSPATAHAPRVTAASPGAEKVALFRRLFAGRADVFPVRWDDIFAGYWPHQDNAIATAFNKATKYVVTHRPNNLGWETSVRIGGGIVEEFRKLKASDGPELHTWGSSKLLQTLIGADLVDEYRIAVFPVVLGEGRRLFENGVPPRGLTLVETRSTPKGVLVNTYRPAGPCPKGV